MGAMRNINLMFILRVDKQSLFTTPSLRKMKIMDSRHLLFILGFVFHVVHAGSDLSMPFNEPVPCIGIKADTQITFYVTPNAGQKDRISFYLMREKDINYVPFVFDVRYNFGGSNYFVLNSKLGGWGTEARPKLPFTAFEGPALFILKIRIKPDVLELHVNDELFTTYAHRTSIENIKFIHVTGPATIQMLSVQGPHGNGYTYHYYGLSENELQTK